ncbi:MAG: glycosyltransferase family 2 protein [Prevotella sp.]|nr:glycosyltransferase family 2 protein [Prevotella sp.]
MKENKIAVLIPCYNEGKTIEKVIRDFQRALPEAEIYVYDNNSTDNTVLIAKKTGVIVRHEYRQGKGNVVRSMFKDINADCYLMLDGDDTYPAENAREMCELILNEHYDMVIGDRLSTTYFQENKRPLHNMGNRFIKFLINHFFNNNIKDIMTGYRAFSPLFVKNIPILSKGFEIETEMTLHALDKNFKIKEVPIAYRNRPEGSVSKLNTFQDGFKVLNTFFKLLRNYKPYLYFSTLAVILIITSLVMFIPVFIDYLHTGLVERFPTLIVSGFIMLLAMLLYFVGLILEIMTNKHRQLYELLLNK